MSENQQDMFDPDKAEGMTEVEAEAFFQRHGYTMRVTRRDGKAMITTRDMKLNRLNVSIENGLVKEVMSVG
ncbi:MAG TPA: hypothetical protein VEF04_04715 [Blastocatellia bacterium]|nr:hypothetical protein [Blastocatellia bacterium]